MTFDIEVVELFAGLLGGVSIPANAPNLVAEAIRIDRAWQQIAEAREEAKKPKEMSDDDWEDSGTRSESVHADANDGPGDKRRNGRPEQPAGATSSIESHDDAGIRKAGQREVSGK